MYYIINLSTNISQKSFYAWLRWKHLCVIKSKMQQCATETELGQQIPTLDI